METDVAVSAADFAQMRAVSIWLWIAFSVLAMEIYALVVRKIIDSIGWMETYSDFPKGSMQAAVYSVGMNLGIRASFISVTMAVMG